MLQSRKIWIDWIRVISVFLVILLHASSRYIKSPEINGFDFLAAAFYSTISSPCVPLFIMISGYLLLPKRETDSKIIDRVKRLLIPLIIWSIIYSFYSFQSTYYSSNNEKVTTLESLKFALFGLQSPKSFHLWFLYMLTGLYLSLPVLRPFSSVLTGKTFVWMTGLTGINHLINSFNPLLLSRLKLSIGWSIGIDFFTLFLYYFLSGYCLGYHSKMTYKTSSLLKIMGLILVAIYAITWVVKTKNLPFDAISFLTPFLSVITFLIFRSMETEESPPWLKKLSTPIPFLAHKSYSVYLIHLILLDLTMFVLEKAKIIDLLGLWFSIPLATITSYLLSLAFLTTIGVILGPRKWLNWLFP